MGSRPQPRPRLPRRDDGAPSMLYLPVELSFISAPTGSNMMAAWEIQNDLRLEDDLRDAIRRELGGNPGREATAVASAAVATLNLRQTCPVDLFSLESVDSMSKDSSIFLKSKARNIAMSWDEGSSDHAARNRPKKRNITEDDLLSLASTVDQQSSVPSSVVMQQHMQHLPYDPEAYHDGGASSNLPGTIRVQHSSVLSGTAQHSLIRAANEMDEVDQEFDQGNEIQRLSQAEEEARQEEASGQARRRDDFASRGSAGVKSTLLEDLRDVLLQTMNEQHHSLKQEVCELRRQMQAGQIEKEIHEEKLMRLTKENEVLRNAIARGESTSCTDKGMQCTVGMRECNRENEKPMSPEKREAEKAKRFPIRTPLRTISSPINSLVSPEKIIGSLNKKSSSLVNEIASLRSKLSSFEPSSPSKASQSNRSAELRSSSDVIENLRSAMNAAKEMSANIATPAKDRHVCCDPTSRLRPAPSNSLNDTGGDDLIELAREIDALIAKTELSGSPHKGKSSVIDTTMDTIPSHIDDENEDDTFIFNILDSFDREFSSV